MAPKVPTPNIHVEEQLGPMAQQQGGLPGGGFAQPGPNIGATVATAGAKLFAEEMIRANKSRAQAFGVELGLMADEVIGRGMQARGENAVGAARDGIDEFNKRRDELAAKMLSSDGQRTLAAASSSAEYKRLHRSLTVHQAGEMGKLAVKNATAYQDRIVSVIGGLSPDQDATEHLEALKITADDKAEAMGLTGAAGSIVADQNYKKALSDAHSNRINVVAVDDPEAANELFEQYKKDIDPARHRKIGIMLNGHKNRQFGNKLAAELQAEHGDDLGAATLDFEEQLDDMTPGQVTQATRAFNAYKTRTRQKIKSNMDNTVNEVVKMMVDDPTLSPDEAKDILSPEMAEMIPESKWLQMNKNWDARAVRQTTAHARTNKAHDDAVLFSIYRDPDAAFAHGPMSGSVYAGQFLTKGGLKAYNSAQKQWETAQREDKKPFKDVQLLSDKIMKAGVAYGRVGSGLLKGSTSRDDILASRVNQDYLVAISYMDEPSRAEREAVMDDVVNKYSKARKVVDGVGRKASTEDYLRAIGGWPGATATAKQLTFSKNALRDVYISYETNTQGNEDGTSRFNIRIDNSTALLGAKLLAAGKEAEFWSFITSGIGVLVTDSYEAEGSRELDI